MYTNSLKSSWTPYQGRSARCRCSWPKPGSKVSLPAANKQTVSWQFFLAFDLCYLPPCRRSWQWCWWGREWAVWEGCPSSSSRRSRGRPPWGSPPCLKTSLKCVSSWSWFHTKVSRSFHLWAAQHHPSRRRSRWRRRRCSSNQPPATSRSTVVPGERDRFVEVIRSRAQPSCWEFVHFSTSETVSWY